MKKVLLWVMVAIIVLSLLGCGGNTAPEQEKELRIVSVAPSNTEIVAALGGLEYLVGVSDFCDYPNEVASIEKVGNAFNLNFEKIISLQPDVVLLMSEGEYADRLRELEIEVVVLQPTTIEEIYSDILKVAEILGEVSRGEEIVANMKAEIAEIEADFLEEKPSVFLLIDSGSLWTVGSQTFNDEVLQKAGGVNVVASETGWLEISAETLLELDPDFILYSWEPSEEITSLPAWQNLTAVKEGRVHQLNGDLTSRSGPRIVEGIRSISQILKGE